MESSNNEISSNTQNVASIREDLVDTAVKFLQNQRVVNTPLYQKQSFLKRKGLTDEEIKVACQKSGAYALYEQQNTPIVPALPQSYAVVHYSLFDRVKEFFHNLAAISVIVYAVYKFYEKFIAPFLFGTKKKSVEDSIADLDETLKSSLDELKESLTSVKVEVDRLKDSSAESTYHDIKSELSTVKGLLLGRKQFPTVSSNSPVVPPSIPAWQLASVPAELDPEQEGKSEELMEVGSGSGSSEPEHCTHKSDSSLEIIYSTKDCDLYRQKSCEDDIEKEDL